MSLEIKELQKNLKDFDKIRGWGLTFSSQTFTHFIEEIGEIARHVLYIDKYKTKWNKEINREEFGEELADAIIFLVKMANKSNIDLEKELKNKIKKNSEERYPIEESKKNMSRYLEDQQKILDDFKEKWKKLK